MACVLVAWPFFFDRGGTDWGTDVAVWRGDTVYAIFWSYTNSTYGADVALVKLDPLGGVVWTFVDNMPGEQFARGLALDSSGNIYVAFWDRQTGTMRSGLVKVSPQGSALWHAYRQVHDSSDAYDVAVNSQVGRVYVTGTGFSGGHEEIFLWALDTLGTDLYVRTWNSGGWLYDIDVAHAVAVNRGDTVVVGGETRDPLDDFHPLLLFYRGSDGTLLKADTLETVETSSDDCVEGLVADPASGKIYGVSKSLTATPLSYVFAWTYSGRLWERAINVPSGQWKLYGIAKWGSLLAVSGLTTAFGSVDLAVVFLDTLGNRYYSADSIEDRGTEDEVWDDVAFNSLGCAVLGGRVDGNGYVQVICPTSLGNNESAARPPLKVWPNPFRGSFRVEGAKAPFRLYDAAGRLVRVYRTAEGLGKGLEPGVYYLEAGKRRVRVIKE